MTAASSPARRSPMTVLRGRAAAGRRGARPAWPPRPAGPGSSSRRRSSGLAILSAGPIVATFGISLTEVGPAHAAAVASGWTTTRPSSPTIASWLALRNTTFYTAVSVPLGMVLALGLALALNQSIRGIAWIRTAYFLPVVTSATAVGLVWAVDLRADRAASSTSSSGSFGLPAQKWVTRPALGDAGDRADERLAGPRHERDHLPRRSPGDPAGVLRRGVASTAPAAGRASAT